MRKVAVVGLGYAGLHTALAFGKVKKTIGYDIDSERIHELKKNYDRHGEFSSSDIKNSDLVFTDNYKELRQANFYIVIVPTPINEDSTPDFSYLKKASSLIASILKKGDIVVYESTVYPGATEEICLPILKNESHLEHRKDFNVGYSPERINPGDKTHTFYNTTKIVAGDTPAATEIIADEYGQVVEKTYIVSTIKTAEAVKISENIQRDINIALSNELAQIFHKLDVDTKEVLQAAATKWNFVSYSPGLVGGHCIGIDPFYLIYKANELGYAPKLITAGRRINENVSHYITAVVIKHLVVNNLLDKNTRVAIFGVTYKENYDDIRNSKVIDLGKELSSYGLNILYHDPVADEEAVKEHYNIQLTSIDKIEQVAAIIIAVPHQQFKQLDSKKYVEKLIPKGIIIDIKGILDRKDDSFKKVTIWRL